MTEAELRNAVSCVWGEALKKPNWREIVIWFGEKKTTFCNLPDPSGVSGLDRFLKSFDWDKKIAVFHYESTAGNDLIISNSSVVTGFSIVETIVIGG